MLSFSHFSKERSAYSNHSAKKYETHSTRLLKKGRLLILTIKLSNYKDIFSHFLRHIYNIRLSISIANVPLCDTHRNYIHHAPLLQLLHLVHLQTAELCQSIKYLTFELLSKYPDLLSRDTLPQQNNSPEDEEALLNQYQQ